MLPIAAAGMTTTPQHLPGTVHSMDGPSIFKTHAATMIAGLMGVVVFLLMVLIIGCALRFCQQRRQRQAYSISTTRSVGSYRASYSKRTLVRGENDNFVNGSVKSIISRRSNSNSMLGTCPPRHHSVSSGCRNGSGRGRKMITSTSILPSSGSSSRTGTLRLSRNPALSHNNRKQSSSSLLSSVSITNFPLPPPPVPPAHPSPTRGSIRAKPRSSSSTGVSTVYPPVKWRYEPNESVPLPPIPNSRSRCNSNPGYNNRMRVPRTLGEKTFDSLRSMPPSSSRRRPINTVLENFACRVPVEIPETNMESKRQMNVDTCMADRDCSNSGSDQEATDFCRPTGAFGHVEPIPSTPTASSGDVGEKGNSPLYTKVNLESRRGHVSTSNNTEEVSVYHTLDYVTADKVATSRVSFVQNSPAPERHKSMDYFHEVLLRWGPKPTNDEEYDHLDSDFSGRFRITHKRKRPVADVTDKPQEQERKPKVKSKSLYNVGNNRPKENPKEKKATI